MNFGTAIQAMIGADVSDLQAKGAQVGSLAGKMNSALGQIGVGLSFGAVTAFFADVTEHAGAVRDLSDKLNLSSDALQAFNYRASQAGAGADQVSTMWDKARKSIDGFLAGEESAAKIFARLHIAQSDLAGSPLDQQVEKIAKAYANAKGEAGAYDAVTDILGAKSAPKLLQVLKELAEEGLPAFTQSAREAGQVIESETIAKLDDLGDRVAALKSGATVAGAGVLDTILKFGEGIGYAAANVVNTFSRIQTNWDVTAEKAVVSSEVQVAAIAKVMAKTEVLDRMDREAFDRTTAALPAKQQILAIEDRALKLRLEAANAGKGTKEWAEKEAEARKLFAEAERIVTEEKKKQNLSAEQQLELSRLHAKQVAGTITIAERARLEVLALQTKQLTNQAQLAPLIEKGYANLTAAEKVRFDALVKQGDKLTEQVTKKEQLIALTKQQSQEESAIGQVIESNIAKWEGFSSAINSVGRGDRELSDRELERKISTTKADIASREQHARMTGFDFLLQPQRFNLKQAEDELRFRENVRSTARIFGEDRAFDRFNGLSESRFKEIVAGLTDNEKNVKALEQLRIKTEAGLARIAENLKGRG